MDLGFVEDPPPPGPPRPNWNAPIISTPRAELASACMGAGRGLTISSPSMISATRFSGTFRRSS
jgi:hypothetical protein